jgi:uncharacterized protein
MIWEKDALVTATGGHETVPPDWMPASQVRPLITEDPALLWLEYHGAEFGFQPDASPYDFSDFIAEKGRQFEAKWLREMAPAAPVVCWDARDVASRSKVEETWELMRQGAPCIAQPALWWAPERIYGAPDVIARGSWLRGRFPGLPGEGAAPDAYIVLDLKFTTKIEESSKAKDRQSYAAQVRLYSYMLGCLQGVMPGRAFLVTRDRLADPFPVEITSTPGGPLDPDLAALRDQFIEIVVNGARYLPWRDAIVASNIGNPDERWHTAKQIIAREKTPGRDPALVYQVGGKVKQALAAQGYPGLDSMLQADPAALPLEGIKGIGAGKARQIRAVLAANRTGQPLFPPPEALPPRKPCEFFVDFEYFTNVDVDFERQWPTLEGHEMIFMIGLGWEEGERWRFEPLIAEAEELQAERRLLERFVELLQARSQGALADPSQVALYHWTAAEVWQTQRAADRHALPAGHPLRHLPWCDLHKIFLDGPAAVPGAFGYGLKEVAAAVGACSPAHATQWAGDLDQGLNAMVMGWKAYQQPAPLDTREFQLLREYLGSDCAALRNILEWLRASVPPGR